MTAVLLDGRFRFDNYVVGATNRLAVAAARAVAESPGAAYNPLFIYSGSGLGKTHLVSAIGHQASARHPDLSAAYITIDEFIEEWLGAVATGMLEPLKQRYRSYDMLLLDDVQFLTGQRETQSELLRLFNQLQAAGKQIVMASDRPPGEIPDVDERLISRLSGGLVVDIGLPDYETRLAILRNLASTRDAAMSPDVLEALSRLDFTNVREMQGALNRLTAYDALGEGVVHAGNLRAILGFRDRPTPPRAMAGASGGEEDEAFLAPAEFADFVADVSRTVEEAVAPWKLRLTEAIAAWSPDGFRTTVLERALHLSREPDVEGLLTTFAAAVGHLGALEREAITLAPG